MLRSVRDSEIRDLRRRGLTLYEIGDRYSLTAERVRQITQGIPPPVRAPKARTCTNCGREFVHKQNKTCSDECARERQRARINTSAKWSRHRTHAVRCERCGRVFQRTSRRLSMRKYYGKSKRSFCSSECYYDRCKTKSSSPRQPLSTGGQE